MSERVRALYEFWAENPAELSFQLGDIITVVNKEDEGWWEGELNGKKGLFPANYVEIVPDKPVSNADAKRAPPPVPSARPVASPPTPAGLSRPTPVANVDESKQSTAVMPAAASVSVAAQPLAPKAAPTTTKKDTPDPRVSRTKFGSDLSDIYIIYAREEEKE